MNVIDAFDHVRVINMASREDRRRETHAGFGRHGFLIDTGSVRFFQAVTPTEAKGFPNPGVRGCFLSHMSVLREARDEDAGNVLVLEDDVNSSRNLR